jgi:hypothetical protein
MLRAFLLACLLLPFSAVAQYKCVIDGRTSYTERPCAPDAKPLELKTDIPITDAERSRAQAENWQRRAELFKAIGRSARVTGADLSAVDRMARYEKDIGDEEARRQEAEAARKRQK